MDADRAKQIMGWASFQGLKKVHPDENISERSAEIFNAAIAANSFLLENPGSAAYDGNTHFQRLLALDMPEDFDVAVHYAVAQSR